MAGAADRWLGEVIPGRVLGRMGSGRDVVAPRLMGGTGTSPAAMWGAWECRRWLARPEPV